MLPMPMFSYSGAVATYSRSNVKAILQLLGGQSLGTKTAYVNFTSHCECDVHGHPQCVKFFGISAWEVWTQVRYTNPAAPFVLAAACSALMTFCSNIFLTSDYSFYSLFYHFFKFAFLATSN